MDEETIKAFESKGYIEVSTGVFERPSDRIKRRDSAIVQECQAQREKRVRLHRPKNKGAKEPDRTPYRVSIVLRFSDKRQHDPDGCLSTILDCLVAARRRLEDFAQTIDRQ